MKYASLHPTKAAAAAFVLTFAGAAPAFSAPNEWVRVGDLHLQGEEVTAVAAGDFAGSETDEIAVAVKTGDGEFTVLVYDGTMVPPRSLSDVQLRGAALPALVAADLDGAPGDELAVAVEQQEGGLAVLVYGFTAEGLRRIGDLRFVGRSVPRLAAGDFDGDGIEELAVAIEEEGGGLAILLYQGATSPMPRRVGDLRLRGDAISALAGGEFDADPAAELAVAIREADGSYAILVYDLDSSGGLGRIGDLRLRAASIPSLAAADFVGDGRDELALVARTDGGGLALLLHEADASGAFQRIGDVRFQGRAVRWVLAGSPGDGIRGPVVGYETEDGELAVAAYAVAARNDVRPVAEVRLPGTRLGGASMVAAASGRREVAFGVRESGGRLALRRYDPRPAVALGLLQIDDVGPDGGALPLNEAADPTYSGAGLIAAIDGSGPVGVVGPPTSWSSKNGPHWIEHVAVVDEDGRLFVFYRGGGKAWKAVDLTDKTGRTVAVVEPASWQAHEDGELDEKLALSTPDGELLVFRWRSGSDWRVESLNGPSGPRVLGPVGAWVTTAAGGRPWEYVAARGTASELTVYYRAPGVAWKRVDVTSQTGTGIGSRVGAGPTGWSAGGVEYVAAPSPIGDLLLFSFDSFRGWQVENLTARMHTPGGPVWRLKDRLAAWTASGGTRIAGRAPDGDLLIFSHSAIEGGWAVTNVSQQAGRKVATAPSAWLVGETARLAATNAQDQLLVFRREPVGWTAVDVGAATGRATRLRPTSWATPATSPVQENLASATPDGRLASFSGPPARPWSFEDASLTASGRVIFAASQKAGVWRSDDYGRFWRQATQPQPAPGQDPQGTLDVAVVLDVAVSPENPQIVLAATGSDHRVASRAGLYRSTDGGATWERKETFVQLGEVLPVSQVTFAPDDPNLVFAAGGSGLSVSTDGGENWDSILTARPGEQIWHLAVSEADSGGRRSLAALGPRSLWYAPDVRIPARGSGSVSWCREPAAWPLGPEVPAFLRGAGLPATNTGTTGGVSSHVLAVVPGSRTRFLLAHPNGFGQTGPVYYSGDQNRFPNGVPNMVGGIGSLWNLDLSSCNLEAGILRSTMIAVPLPPTYSGAGVSGVSYVYARRTPSGYLVFLSNSNTVHVSEGLPSAATDWHRLDGLDASDSTSINRSLVHPDPHDLLVSPDFDLDLGPASGTAPFDRHASLATCHRGRLWMAHDGGVTRSSDCAASWAPAADGLDTLNFMNVAVSPQRSGADNRLIPAPHLFGGTTHNDMSYSLDGGRTWKQPRGACGDCDVWFTDPAQPTHVLRILPRSSRFDLLVGPLDDDDLRKRDPKVRVPFPDYVRPFAISFKVMEGYRPIVYTPSGETNLPGGDYVTIQDEGRTVGGGMLAGGRRVLLRARDTFTTQTGAAVWSAESGRAGGASDLPATADVVQASGGHDDTDFFVGDGRQVWRSERNRQGTIASWRRIVPNAHDDASRVATDAQRFFVNPYDPQELYVAGTDAVRRSTDGGTSWPVDTALDGALTGGGSFLRQRRAATTGGEASTRNPDRYRPGRLDLLPGESENHADEFVLNDMVFDRDSSRRFAVGIAGVFFSSNGSSWQRLIDARALPGRPRAAWFDTVTDPNRKSLYVAYHGRGILRILPIP